MRVFRIVLGVTCVLIGSGAYAVEVKRDPQCGGGVCEVANVSVLAAPTDTPLDVDVVFANMKNIQTDASGAPTTNAEFSIGNTANAANLDYRITMDLGDLNGNLLTSGLLVHQATAPAGNIHIVNLPLTSVPAGLTFDNIQFLVETECSVPGACSTFDFTAAGGGGSSAGASGPIRFNRAQGGFSIPEPSSLSGLWAATVVLVTTRRRHARPLC